MTVAVFDSDHLKVVNDRFGHGEGNRLLVDLAGPGPGPGRTRSAVRPSDFVARL